MQCRGHVHKVEGMCFAFNFMACLVNWREHVLVKWSGGGAFVLVKCIMTKFNTVTATTGSRFICSATLYVLNLDVDIAR